MAYELSMTKKNKSDKRKQKQKEAIKRSRQRRQEKNRENKRLDNINTYGRSLTRRQFDAYCYCRMPLVRYTTKEVEWYSLFKNRLLAVIVRDVTDQDYGFVILGRDSRRLFRCIDLCESFFKTASLARKELAKKLGASYLGNVKDIYPQDEVEPSLHLFESVIPESQQHDAYKVLANEPRYEAARNIISEIANSFIDNDGHYVREFQSINFQARLWELYLHIYFHNEGLSVENNHASPDFEVSFFNEKYFIEATTVNPSNNDKRPDLPAPESDEEISERLNDFMPIKFGSSLYSKLSKKYWEMDHVKDNPLILAVHDYHNSNAMTWSRTALSEYLYGIRTRLKNGAAEVSVIEKHSWKGKEILSGFFYQEDSENVSAVLFSNQATIPKFNRMGKIGGLGSEDIEMIRVGYLYNPEPNALRPIPFSKNVDDSDYEESWSDGLIMFHNPNAKLPVNPDAFKDISHIFYSEEDGFTGIQQPYDVLGSMTFVIN